MNIVIGTLAKDRAWILPDWFEAINRQGIDVEVVCLISPSSDETEEVCEFYGADLYIDDREGRSQEDIDLHHWGQPSTYEYMASLRNKLISIAKSKRADVLFSLDTDILIPEGSLSFLLERLASVQGVVAPAVNMGQDATAWNVMDWAGHQGTSALRSPTVPKDFGKVDVVMAAMLLDKTAMRSQWANHPQGEDIGYCIDAHKKSIPRWWEPTVRCDHVMRKL